MAKNFLLIVVGAIVSCVVSIPCLALQETWEDVLQDTTADEAAVYSNKTPNRSAIDGHDNKIPINPNPDSKNNSLSSGEDAAKILAQFESEPGIRETQEAAIKYAEVHNEKIKEWRKNVKQRAILPTLSVGVNHDINGTSEIYTSSTANYWAIGPDEKSTGWDVRASWDLGDLIWNNDQNNIDVRSRLMVQLRDDILNEVTHLYFERRKLQIEMLTNPPKNLQAQLDKELRFQELTAGIDALTGGWFSKKLSTR